MAACSVKFGGFTQSGTCLTYAARAMLLTHLGELLQFLIVCILWVLSRLRKSLQGFATNHAWLSDHFTEEPVEAIISESPPSSALCHCWRSSAVPTGGEVKRHIDISEYHILQTDVENRKYDIVEPFTWSCIIRCNSEYLYCLCLRFIVLKAIGHDLLNCPASLVVSCLYLDCLGYMSFLGPFWLPWACCCDVIETKWDHRQGGENRASLSIV